MFYRQQEVLWDIIIQKKLNVGLAKLLQELRSQQNIPDILVKDREGEY